MQHMNYKMEIEDKAEPKKMIILQNQDHSEQEKREAFKKKLRKYSNPEQAQKMAYKYLGKTAKICPSDRPEKKYKIQHQELCDQVE